MTTIFLVKDFNQYRSLVIRGTDINCSNLTVVCQVQSKFSKKDKQGWYPRLHTHRNSDWILYIFMTDQLNIAIFIVMNLWEIIFEKSYA